VHAGGDALPRGDRGAAAIVGLLDKAGEVGGFLSHGQPEAARAGPGRWRSSRDPRCWTSPPRDVGHRDARVHPARSSASRASAA
jgi:hypothetical protein